MIHLAMLSHRILTKAPKVEVSILGCSTNTHLTDGKDFIAQSQSSHGTPEMQNINSGFCNKNKHISTSDKLAKDLRWPNELAVLLPQNPWLLAEWTCHNPTNANFSHVALWWHRADFLEHRKDNWYPRAKTVLRAACEFSAATYQKCFLYTRLGLSWTDALCTYDTAGKSPKWHDLARWPAA